MSWDKDEEIARLTRVNADLRKYADKQYNLGFGEGMETERINQEEFVMPVLDELKRIREVLKPFLTPENETMQYHKIIAKILHCRHPKNKEAQIGNNYHCEDCGGSWPILPIVNKPTPEKYGWATADSHETESGWMFEGGESAYYEALQAWEDEQSKVQKMHNAQTCGYCLEKADSLPDRFGCKSCIKKYS